MGDTIDPTVFTDLPTGQRIYFCCPACNAKLRANPEKYAKNLEKQGVHVDVKKLKQELEKQGSGKHDDHADAHAGHGHS
jgi:YHS domain-containing protein